MKGETCRLYPMTFIQTRVVHLLCLNIDRDSYSICFVSATMEEKEGKRE